jgi:hypothetical protein
MACNFLRGDRDQPFLLPPDLRDWLPNDHLAWFILDVVDQLDLRPFLRGYRADGHGRGSPSSWQAAAHAHQAAAPRRGARPNAVANTTDPDSRFLHTRADGAEDMVHRVHFQQAKGSVLASHHQRGREEHHRDDQRLDN